MMASADNLWTRAEGEETLFNQRGTAYLNPLLKAYFECITQVKQLARQLGMSLREQQALERGQLSITLLEQKLAGVGTNELDDFEKSLATADGEEW